MVNTATSPKAVAFLAKNPTLICSCGGFDFYESPVYGDESPLVAISPRGFKFATDFWDAPDPDIDAEAIQELERADMQAVAA